MTASESSSSGIVPGTRQDRRAHARQLAFSSAPPRGPRSRLQPPMASEIASRASKEQTKSTASMAQCAARSAAAAAAATAAAAAGAAAVIDATAATA